MTNHHPFTDEEWRTLQFAPFWAFQGAGGMDSGIDERERQAFFDFVRSGPKLPDGVASDVMASIASDLDGISQAWDADPRSLPDGLDQTAVLLAKLPFAEARTFAAVLMVIALNVARASGGGGLFSRGPIGIMERGALSGMAQRFKITAEEAERLLSETHAQGLDSAGT